MKWPVFLSKPKNSGPFVSTENTVNEAPTRFCCETFQKKKFPPTVKRFERVSPLTKNLFKIYLGKLRIVANLDLEE